MNNVSIIISYKESHFNKNVNYKNYQNYRKFNIIKILEYINDNLKYNTEIVIVEQDNKSTIDWLNNIKFNKNIEINHIFVKNDGVFNKGWGYNIGVNNCKYDNLIFQDGDIVVHKKAYEYIELIDSKEFDVVKPYSSISYLNYINSHLFYTKELDFNKLSSMKTVTSGKDLGVLTGGSFFIRKSDYLKIKGFDENCYGYAHEDDIVDIKIKNFGLNIFYDDKYNCLHLYHFSGKNKFDVLNNYYSRIEENKKLYESIKKMNNIEFLEYIEKIKDFGKIKNI